MSVKVYINGKEIPKEELKNIKIHKESVKKIFANKIRELEEEKRTAEQDSQEDRHPK